MGLHNLPASYDAWRTTPPDDFPRNLRGLPETIMSALLIEAGDVQIDAEGIYSTETGELVAVQINARQRSVAEIARALASLGVSDDAGTKWDADLCPVKLGELIADQLGSDRDDYGDWLRDQRGDH